MMPEAVKVRKAAPGQTIGGGSSTKIFTGCSSSRC